MSDLQPQTDHWRGRKITAEQADRLRTAAMVGRHIIAAIVGLALTGNAGWALVVGSIWNGLEQLLIILDAGAAWRNLWRKA